MFHFDLDRRRVLQNQNLLKSKSLIGLLCLLLYGAGGFAWAADPYGAIQWGSQTSDEQDQLENAVNEYMVRYTQNLRKRRSAEQLFQKSTTLATQVQEDEKRNPANANESIKQPNVNEPDKPQEEKRP